MFSHRFDELARSVLDCCYTSVDGEITSRQALDRAQQLLDQTRRQDGIVYVIGNGGSAGIASHFSNDLMKSRQIPSQTLYDTNLLTCLANDIGYANAFSYSLQTHRRPQQAAYDALLYKGGESPRDRGYERG